METAYVSLDTAQIYTKAWLVLSPFCPHAFTCRNKVR